jgi:hypothetical protein
MGSREIGTRLEVSRQRIQQLADRPDFPEPVASLSMGRIWWAAEIEIWAGAWKTGRPCVFPPSGWDDDICQRLAARIADQLAETGHAFIEDDRLGSLAHLLRHFLVAGGIQPEISQAPPAVLPVGHRTSGPSCRAHP